LDRSTGSSSPLFWLVALGLVFVDLRATCHPQNRHPGNASALNSHLHTACHLIFCRERPGLSPHGPLPTHPPQESTQQNRTCRYLGRPSYLYPQIHLHDDRPTGSVAPCGLLISRRLGLLVIHRLASTAPAATLLPSTHLPPGTRLCRNHRLVYNFPRIFDRQKGRPGFLDSTWENAAEGASSHIILSISLFPEPP